MSLSVAASGPSKFTASSHNAPTMRQQVRARPVQSHASFLAGAQGPPALAPQRRVPPHVRQPLVVRADGTAAQVVETIAKFIAGGVTGYAASRLIPADVRARTAAAEFVTVGAAALAAFGPAGAALMAAKAGIGAAEGLAAGFALSTIPVTAHEKLKGGLYYEGCVVAFPPLFGTLVGTAVGALLPSNDLLHVAKTGAEGAGIVAAAGMLGVLLGCVAFKAYYEGREEDSDRIGMGGPAFFGGWIGGFAGTAAGLAYVVKNCL